MLKIFLQKHKTSANDPIVIIHHQQLCSSLMFFFFRCHNDGPHDVKISPVRKKTTKRKKYRNGVKDVAAESTAVEFDLLDLLGLPDRRHYHHRVHAHL